MSKEPNSIENDGNCVDLFDKKKSQFYSTRVKVETVFSNISDLVAEIDRNNCFSFVNKSFTDFLGYTPCELIGNKLLDYLHEEDKLLAINAKKQILETNSATEVTARALHKNGSYRYFKAKVFTENQEGGSIILLAKDITDSISAYQEIEESKIKYSELLDSISEGVAIVDENEYFVFANDAADKIFEAGGKLIGSNTSDYLDSENFEFNLHQTSLRRQGKKSRYEIEITTPSGTNKFLEVYAIPKLSETNDFEGTFAVFHDVTNKVNIEKALIESEEKFRKFFQNIPLGVFRSSIEGKLLEVNFALCKMLGYSSPDDLISSIEHVGKDFYAIPEQRQQIIDDAAKSNKTNNYTVSIKRKDGSVSIGNLHVTAIKDNHGNILTFEGIAEDITEKQSAEKKLHESYQTFSDVVASIPSGLFIYQFEEPDRLFLISGNKNTELLTGINLEENIGKEFNEIWTKAKDLGITDKFLSVVKTGKNIDYNDVYYSDDNLEGTFKITAFNIPGNKLGIAFENISKLKKAQEEIQKSETKFKQLIESSFDAIYIMEGRRYNYVNPKFTELTGYSLEEVSAPDFDFGVLLTDVSRNKIEERYNARMKGEQVPNKYETQIISKDGEIKYVEISNVSINDGGTILVMGIIRDISEQRLQQIELNLAQQTYSGILNSLSEAVYILNEKMEFLDVNHAAEIMYGYDRDYFIGKTPAFTDALELNNDLQHDVLFNLAYNGEPQQFEFWGKRSNGEVFPKSVSLTNGYFFGEKVVIATARDITDSKIAEDNLRKSEDEYRNLVEKMHEGLIVVDNDDTIVFVNDYLVEMLGYSSEDELLGKIGYETIVAPEAREIILQKNIERRNNQSDRYEVLMITKDGKPLPVLINAVPISDENGEIIGSMGTCLDISEQKRIEKELIAAKEKAEESDRLKSAFLANMSHEIRTPMNGIIGFTSLLADNDIEEQERNEYVAVINSSCQRLLKTVNDILDISKLDAAQVEVFAEEFSLNKLLKELYSLHSTNYEKKNLSLCLKLPPELERFKLFGDEQKLYQILNNLLNNAFKFTSNGTVEFGCFDDNDTLQFYVKDTGIGISQENLDFVFGRFNQENFSISRNYEGSGLGLAICKALIRLMGGDIWVESTPSEGSVFCFSIPLKGSFAEEFKYEKYRFVQDESKDKDMAVCKIIVAEDDPMNFLLVQRILKREGNPHILHAKNGLQAIELYKDNTDTCVIIMDLKMPEMDGLEASRQIRLIDKDIPIIALTAYAMSGDKERAMQAGCNDYLSKPIESNQLISKLKNLVKMDVEA